jgi:hypothetical protein
MVPASVARLSGAADTARGARRTVAKRSAVEKRILTECLGVLSGSALLRGCVLNRKRKTRGATGLPETTCGGSDKDQAGKTGEAGKAGKGRN